MWCIADLKHCINYPMIGRCPSACSESTCSPSALSSPCPGRSRKDCGHLLRSLSGIPLARHRRTRPVQRPRESPPRPPGHRRPRPRRLRALAKEGKGLSPAGHHRVRLSGEERHPAAAGDGRRSVVEKDNMIKVQNGTKDPFIDKSSRFQ